eukprot:CAMPEP_0173404666 /NCGR_PEP_ID=MMETSP1356-20130122/59938_1 /TAXON_ID=77927 ORGANISM="Hemiselmis virescens, Strain PCC157" /NCGR_SAMPLE_ID=MMETSP1356 /ASSEMBLY_ACC=CAM_ASM_000847 /LENGTH=549 /DNA_ID=CAMNT_0014365373 /DNA_START=1 /DNA_END=1647 /DNA_ORIENTATION=-
MRATIGNENTATKLYKALQEVDRMLDILEPGSMALSFNGGKDAVAMMHIIKDACSQHRTHKWTHIQPIWFKNPTDEFPELIEFVQEQAHQQFMHPGGFRTIDGKALSRLWSIHITSEKDFIAGLAKIQQQIPLRCIIMGTRRTDPGCRNLSSLTSSSGNYPPFMRFNPILDWSYRDVWDFINACELPYCTLYDHGYTSLGTVKDTIRNPELLKSESETLKQEDVMDPRSRSIVPFLAMAQNVPGMSANESGENDEKQASRYNPAWMLLDETKERSSRLKKTAVVAQKTETAGILIIGNEVISGSVKDENGPFLMKHLRDMGLDTIEVAVVRDDMQLIADNVRRMSGTHTFVFTAGGIGPTHDDITLPAIAQAFGCGLQTRPEILELLHQYLPGQQLNEYHIKMASIPQGSHLITSGPESKDKWPLIVKNNVYIMPGVPEYCRSKFMLVRDDLVRQPFFVAKLYINEAEPQLADLLTRAEAQHKDVHIGSYPIIGSTEYQVIITLESKDQYALTSALSNLRVQMPRDIIIKVETDTPQGLLAKAGDFLSK